jgi:predicted PurR-regulated permease PerM
MNNDRRNRKTFQILLLAVSVALVWILLPFFSAIFWGTILAVIFQPLQRRLTARFGNRPNLAALTTGHAHTVRGDCHPATGPDHGDAGAGDRICL